MHTTVFSVLHTLSKHACISKLLYFPLLFACSAAETRGWRCIRFPVDHATAGAGRDSPTMLRLAGGGDGVRMWWQKRAGECLTFVYHKWAINTATEGNNASLSSILVWFLLDLEFDGPNSAEFPMQTCTFLTCTVCNLKGNLQIAGCVSCRLFFSFRWSDYTKDVKTECMSFP